MHETDSFTANTANYRYGFLSAGLHQVLAKPAGAELDSDEQRQVEMGREFVAEVLAGASLVSKGQTKAASPSHATNVLAYALGPLQSMERVKDLSEERVIQFLEQVHNALDETVQAHRVTGQPERLKDAAEFFGHLSDEILATLS
jgi:hypothetical protein